MKSVWKFPIEIDRDTIEVLMPQGAVILDVQKQHDQVCLWAQVDSDAPQVARYFSVVGTGHRIPNGKMNHVGTVQDGTFVWHLFEPTR